MAEKTTMTFIAAMKDFFGMKDGQTLTQFSAELKALDEKEKEFFKLGLQQNGYTSA